MLHQNDRHMVQHVLLPVIIHFHWNLFIFEFLTIYFYFFYSYIGGQVSNGSTVRFSLNIFCALVTMATAAILNFFNPTSCHTRRWIFLQSFMKFNERNPFFFKSPFFVSMATAAKLVQPIPICLTYLVPLDVDVVPIKFHLFLFGE